MSPHRRQGTGKVAQKFCSVCVVEIRSYLLSARNGLTTIVRFALIPNPDTAELSAHRMEYECTLPHVKRLTWIDHMIPFFFRVNVTYVAPSMSYTTSNQHDASLYFNPLCPKFEQPIHPTQTQISSTQWLLPVPQTVSHSLRRSMSHQIRKGMTSRVVRSPLPHYTSHYLRAMPLPRQNRGARESMVWLG
jgi:hypothetical protein